MADTTLKTDYKDDVLDTSKNTQRKYRMIQNVDGTVSFEDVTDYSLVGDSFGALDVNTINIAVNFIKKLLGDTDISKIYNGTVTGILDELNSDSVKFIDALKNGTDFNTLALGVYRCANATDTFLNCPVTKKLFVIEVLGSGGDVVNRGIQRITTEGNDSRVYVRNITAGSVWSDWDEYVKSSDFTPINISNKITLSSEYGTISSVTASKIGNTITLSFSFNVTKVMSKNKHYIIDYSHEYNFFNGVGWTRLSAGSDNDVFSNPVYIIFSSNKMYLTPLLNDISVGNSVWVSCTLTVA